MINKLSSGVEKFLDGVSIVLMVAMVVFLFIQLFGRAVFNHGFSWTEESAKICLIMLSFVGAAVTSISGVHVSITILSDALKGRTKKIIYVIQQSITVLFLLLVFIYSFPAIEIASKSVTTNTHINNGIIYAAIPISCAIMIFAHGVKIIKQVRNKDYVKEQDEDRTDEIPRKPLGGEEEYK